ncbi:hypothetical protein [Streptomyces endocoffeicus]|nr:hypothetical protein [Streptomyces endocoffeicus]
MRCGADAVLLLLRCAEVRPAVAGRGQAVMRSGGQAVVAIKRSGR